MPARKKPTIFTGTWPIGPRDADAWAEGRAAAREQGTADREGKAMGTRKRTERRLQVEALEGRLAPGAGGGGVVLVATPRGLGEEIPQVQVAPVSPLGGPSGGVLGDVQVAHVEPLRGPSGGTL